MTTAAAPIRWLTTRRSLRGPHPRGPGESPTSDRRVAPGGRPMESCARWSSRRPRCGDERRRSTRCSWWSAPSCSAPGCSWCATGRSPTSRSRCSTRINGLPGALYPVLWPFQQLGVLVVGPIAALVAACFRRFRLALLLLVATVAKLVLERVVKAIVTRARPATSIGPGRRAAWRREPLRRELRVGPRGARSRRSPGSSPRTCPAAGRSSRGWSSGWSPSPGCTSAPTTRST